jgi:hypothetical protein
VKKAGDTVSKYIYIYIVYLSHVILSINACGNLSSSSYFYFGGSGRWRTQGIMESNHQFYPLVLVQFPAVGVVYAPKKKKKKPLESRLAKPGQTK